MPSNPPKAAWLALSQPFSFSCFEVPDSGTLNYLEILEGETRTCFPFLLWLWVCVNRKRLTKI